MSLQVGDLVTRISYGEDVLFRVTAVDDKDNIELKGEELRLVADAPLADLKKVDDDERSEFEEEEKKKEEQCYRLFRQDNRLMREKNEYELSSAYATPNPQYFEMRVVFCIWMATLRICKNARRCTTVSAFRYTVRI